MRPMLAKAPLSLVDAAEQDLEGSQAASQEAALMMLFPNAFDLAKADLIQVLQGLDVHDLDDDLRHVHAPSRDPGRLLSAPELPPSVAHPCLDDSRHEMIAVRALSSKYRGILDHKLAWSDPAEPPTQRSCHTADRYEQNLVFSSFFPRPSWL